MFKKFLIVCLMVIVMFSIYKIHKIEVEEQKREEGKYYKINVLIPKTDNRKLNREIYNLVEANKAKVIDKAQSDKPKDKYELIINYTKTVYRDVLFVNINIYKFLGKNYEREDLSFYYLGEVKLDVSYFFQRDYLKELSSISKKYLQEKNLSEESINNLTLPNEKNFHNFYFNNFGLNIFFNTATTNELITIPYEEINHILKEKFQSITIHENTIPIIKNITDVSNYKDKKLIALTFDDGPSSNTIKLLDGLKKTNSKVTFFLLGTKVYQYRDVIKRMYSESHQLGNHTYHHLNLRYLSKEKALEEINYTNNAIYTVTGHFPTVFRPPYGIISDEVKKEISQKVILWNVDFRDWRYKSSKRVFNQIVKNAKDGNIIVLHDTYKTTVDGVLLAVDKLVKEGYRFVTIDELISIREIELENDKSIFVN